MRFTVFGATGGTGRQVVRQALEEGHEVTAVVRDPARLQAAHDRLRAVRADVADPAAIAPALEGAGAVVSALGSREGRRPTTICSAGTRAIVAAMGTAGVRRLVVVSAAPLAPDDPADTVPYRLLVKPVLLRLLRAAYDDMAVMEDEVRASGLDWTIARPPQLTDAPARGHHRLVVGGTVRRGYRITRADLADALLRLVNDPRTVGAAVGVAQ